MRAIAAGSMFAVALLENAESGLSPQVALTQHKNTLTLSWAFRAAEHAARLFECEEAEEGEEGEEDEGEEGEESEEGERPWKERKCVAHPEIFKEIITKASQPEAYRERNWTFSEDKHEESLEKGQPYEAVLRSFTGLGETGGERRHFIFESPGLLPAIKGLNPNAGPLLGKTTVRIGGYKFTLGATVKFGNVVARNVTVVSENLIIAEAPAGIEGTVPVTVTTGAGTSKERPVDQYTYAAVPTVSKVEQKSGGVGDHTPVTIKGANLLEASTVNFGSVGSAKVTVAEATSITAVTPVEPLESVGVVNVTVTTPGGTSRVVLASKFQYTPTVTSVRPSEGPKGGGTTVTVAGSGFMRGSTATRFKFGSTSATSGKCASANVCTVVSPAHGEKTKVHVKATVKEITSPATSADYFTYS